MRHVGAGVKGTGACLPPFSWDTALGMAWGRVACSFKGWGSFGEEGGTVIYLGEVKVSHFSPGPITHEEKLQFNRDNLINYKACANHFLIFSVDHTLHPSAPSAHTLHETSSIWWL